MDIAYTLHTLIPSAKYFGSLTENTREAYDKLEWHDERPKPSWEVLEKTALGVCKIRKKAELAEARWLEETSGVVLPSGVEVATDDRSQTKMIGIAMKAAQDPDFTVRWKANGQWVTLDASEILNLNVYISNVIQKLFEKEESLSKMVDSCQTIEEVKVTTWEQVL